MIYIRFPAKLNVKKSSEKLAFKYLFSEISMHIQKRIKKNIQKLTFNSILNSKFLFRNK